MSHNIKKIKTFKQLQEICWRHKVGYMGRDTGFCFDGFLCDEENCLVWKERERFDKKGKKVISWDMD